MHIPGRETLQCASIVLSCLGLAAGTGPVSAEQSATPAPFLSIELNGSDQHGDACRLTFVARNQLAADLNTAVFETVLFSTDGAVLQMTLFDFQALPAGRPRVRQFDVPGTQCDGIAQVLINGVHSCTGDGIANADCAAALRPETRTKIEVLG
ncbi:hypothetical protein [Actibacterium ureilyticum]|uniref:hypothetical protein n=1 Tax=Actibacterium ureilyticum TaxID=1590614 RepID=UPI001FE57702|nr:hypothetical protein [Actibacterium ureilyticum]